jgi:hypothetical protein
VKADVFAQARKAFADLRSRCAVSAAAAIAEREFNAAIETAAGQLRVLEREISAGERAAERKAREQAAKAAREAEEQAARDSAALIKLLRQKEQEKRLLEKAGIK